VDDRVGIPEIRRPDVDRPAPAHGWTASFELIDREIDACPQEDAASSLDTFVSHEALQVPQLAARVPQQKRVGVSGSGQRASDEFEEVLLAPVQALAQNVPGLFEREGRAQKAWQANEKSDGDHRVLEEAAEGGLEPGHVSVS
jgi:hypothetical protein